MKKFQFKNRNLDILIMSNDEIKVSLGTYASLEEAKMEVIILDKKENK